MGTKPESKEEAVLSALCDRFGYCLQHSALLELLAQPTHTPSGLVDAVIVAEGLDPATVGHRAEMIEQAERIFRSPVWSSEP
jgi:hypothetical protein